MTTIELEYEVKLPPKVIQRKLFILGQLIIREMRRLAIDMGLVGVTGAFSQGFSIVVKDDMIIIENNAKYAEQLEFGTYEFGMGFSKTTFPSSPFPKKKDLPRKAREGFPRGGQPFAVMRRVLYNKQLMGNLIRKVFQ